jgi:hypothetical protein
MAGLPTLSPKGRYVQGDAFEAQTKDQQGSPLTIKTGPNAGQPTQRYFMAVAFLKSDPATLPYLLQMRSVAVQAWAKFFPAPTNTPPLFGCTHPKFSIKIMDGDGVDDNGKQNSTKEGFAGHWVVKYSSAFAPQVFEAGKHDQMQRVDIDKAKHSLLKRGYYVRVFANVESNMNDQRPGLYVNLNMVEIVHAGEEIVSGPDAATVFGGGTIDHSATPGLKMTGAYTYEALKAGGWSDDQMIAAGHAVRQAPPAAPSPPVPSTPAAPAALVMTGAYTYEALKAGGWSDDQMIAAGHATRPAPVVAAPLPPSNATPPAVPVAPTLPASITHGTAGGAGAPPPPSVTPSPSSYTGFMQAPAGPTLTAAAVAQGYTYDALKGAGWTDAQMIQQGLLQG